MCAYHTSCTHSGLRYHMLINHSRGVCVPYFLGLRPIMFRASGCHAGLWCYHRLVQALSPSSSSRLKTLRSSVSCCLGGLGEWLHKLRDTCCPCY